MPNRNFNELYDLILPYVPAVETPLVDYHIRRVVREFCRRTTLWRHRVTITTQPGVNDYLLSPYDATEGVIGGGGGGGGGGGAGGWVLPSTLGLQVVLTATNYAEGPDFGSVPATWYADGDTVRIAIGSIGGYERLVAADFEITLTDGTTHVTSYPMRVKFQPVFESEGTVYYWEAGVGSEEPLPTRMRFLTGPVATPAVVFNEPNQHPPSRSEFEYSYDLFLPDTPYSVTTMPITAAVLAMGRGTVGGEEEARTLVANLLVEVYNGTTPEQPVEICDPYSIISVVCDGKPIDPVPEDYRQPFGARPANARPKGWYSPSARVVHLYPTPDAAYTIVVDVVCALTMTPTNPVMPEFLFVDYREIIADGVIASLKILGNKPWFDPEGAVIYNRRYVNAVQGIRAKLRDANQPNVSTMRGPRFGR